MKKRILSILIITLLITTVIPITSVISGELGLKNTYSTDQNADGFILDQMQTTSIYYDVVSYRNSLAQSFKPSITPLAKVRLLVSGEDQIIKPLIVSIRNDLNEEDLTSISVFPKNIPNTPNWINFDFKDISVDIEETYYIVVQSSSNLEYHWFLSYNQDVDFYERGSAWFKNASISENWVNWDVYHQPYNDFCFKSYSYSGKISDLECNGIFGWTDQKPGIIINDSFTIENIGDPESLLNWQIKDIPNWGNWTFTPLEGYDLTPEEDTVMVNVSVLIPNEENKNYAGEIKIVNKDDENDYCIISVSLSTPKNKEENLFKIIIPAIQKILQNFPFLQSLLTRIIKI